MFLSRLDDARDEVEHQKISPIKVAGSKSKISERQEAKHLQVPFASPTKQQPTITASGQKPQSSKILLELNEYLFDLFDANCMEDFHKMDQFEREAIQLFDSEDFISNPNYEFSHQQYRKHQEFLELFESLVENFLRTNHYTSDKLYSELQTFINSKSTDNQTKHNKKSSGDGKYSSDNEDDDECSQESSDQSNALEIVEVIAYYTSFEKWCEMMKENVKLKRYFRSFEERMKSAANDMKDTKENQAEMKLSSHK